MSIVKEGFCKHDILTEQNGFSVCLKCGICIKEHYFISDKRSIGIRNGINPTKVVSHRSKSINGSWNKNSYKYHRLSKLNLQTTRIRPYVKNKIQYLTNILIDYIGEGQSVKLWRYLINSEPKGVKEMYFLAFSYIYKRDLCILTSQLLGIVRKELGTGKKFRIYKDLKDMKTIRRYYWYINKTLSIIDGIPIKTKYGFYKSVKQYYDIIRFDMYSMSSPLNIIKYLVYETINQHYKCIPKRLRTLQKFQLQHLFKFDIRSHLEKLKKLNLDQDIEYKLDFKFKKKVCP